MKIKLKNTNTRLPNCWKSCGVDKDAWDKLQKGEEIEVKTINGAIVGLVDEIKTSKTPTIKKENK